jgi:hypothetical protein
MLSITTMLDHIKVLANGVRFRWKARRVMVRLNGEISWAVSFTSIVEQHEGLE